MKTWQFFRVASLRGSKLVCVEHTCQGYGDGFFCVIVVTVMVAATYWDPNPCDLAVSEFNFSVSIYYVDSWNYTAQFSGWAHPVLHRDSSSSNLLSLPTLPWHRPLKAVLGIMTLPGLRIEVLVYKTPGLISSISNKTNTVSILIFHFREKRRFPSA